MQQGGSPYGALPPQQQQAELSPFHLAAGGGETEAAPPISTRPPPSPAGGAPGGGGVTGAAAAPNYKELGVGDDPLGVPGDEGISGILSGNRWPRQETLALLKIRSDMDAAFRDASLKGPLWEEVSRKLGELGYRRSAKKCKEKFENVHKYYKRTKEGRSGRQDGKSYRFFSQLEALHSTTATNTNPLLSAAPQSMATTPTAFAQNNQAQAQAQAQNQSAVAQNQSATTATRAVHPIQISAPTPITTAPPAPQANLMNMFSENPIAPGSTVGGAAPTGIGFSSNTSSSSGSESEEDDDDDEATEEVPSSGRKRKRESGGGGSKKMMAFFEGLMRQVMERQESMQQRFLEAIEKREQDRMIREEAWRRQEMLRMAREHELAAQERAAASSRDATIISFLQKVTGQMVQLPPPPSVGISSAPSTTVIQTHPNLPPASQIHQATPQPPPQQQQQQNTDAARHHQPITPLPQQPPASSELVPMASSEPQEGALVSVSLDPTSSRWPKSEVHALIKLRSELDSRYQETGPKGPLWEEISAGLQRLGYNRSAKRCKEKWENINKYFKKVKESNKKRPDDAKTCPYFHQLDALYRNKHNNSGGGDGSRSGGSSMPALTHQNSNLNLNPNPSPITMIAPPQVQHEGEMDKKNGNGGNAGQNSGGSSNGGIGSNFFGVGTSAGGGGDNGGIMKKPEDIMKELMGQSTNNDYGNPNEPESDNMDEDDEEEDDEDDEDGKGQYRIQFQNVGNNNAGNGASANTGGKTSGTFLAMVR